MLDLLVFTETAVSPGRKSRPSVNVRHLKNLKTKYVNSVSIQIHYPKDVLVEEIKTTLLFVSLCLKPVSRSTA